jgi:hypothetical protein
VVRVSPIWAARRRPISAQLLVAPTGATRCLRAYPLLLVVPEADSIAPVPAALKVARQAPRAELFRSAGGPYDVYEGGASFAEILRVELEFLRRHAKTPAL